jgi:hypothetical protein
MIIIIFKSNVEQKNTIQDADFVALKTDFTIPSIVEIYLGLH